jgi:hypothetical protein
MGQFFVILNHSNKYKNMFKLKTGRHGIAEILLKVALKHQKSNKTNRCAKLSYA